MILKLLCKLLALSGIVLLKMCDRLLIRDVLVVIADLSLGGRGLDGLRELLALFESLGKLYSANGAVLLI